MTDLRKAAEMALDELEHFNKTSKEAYLYDFTNEIAALRQALNVDAIDTSENCVDKTEKREHEPVAWEKNYDIACSLLRQAHDILATTQYPIKRPWVSLTDEERDSIARDAAKNDWHDYIVIGATEAKLKEKNT